MKKYLYDANIAHEFYRKTLVDTRGGINMEASEFQAMAEVIAPLIKKGQSIYQILLAHPEIKVSERTIYNYIGQGLLKPYGVDDFTLKEKVKRKQQKKRYNPRNDRSIFVNRSYKDYLAFIALNSDLPIVQMDTVYNEPGGPYIQTLLFESTNFMIGFVHPEKTVAAMAGTFDYLEGLLGKDLFRLLFPVVLTDRGSEFTKPELFEFSKDDGEQRLNIFYCDPLQATQKAQIENNHNFVRDIIPNNRSLVTLTNEDLQLVFTHINNTPRRSLNDRSPYEIFTFIYSKEVTSLLKIKKLQADEIILDSSLLKLNKK
jgi:IS30 family transposase